VAIQKNDTYIEKQCSHVEFPYFVMGSHLGQRHTIASRLSTHPFKYALFSRKNRVQEIGAGVAGYGDQGTAGLQQSTNTTSVSIAGTVDSLESES